jgi:hypothetical protein
MPCCWGGFRSEPENTLDFLRLDSGSRRILGTERWLFKTDLNETSSTTTAANSTQDKHLGLLPRCSTVRGRLEARVLPLGVIERCYRDGFAILPATAAARVGAVYFGIAFGEYVIIAAADDELAALQRSLRVGSHAYHPGRTLTERGLRRGRRANARDPARSDGFPLAMNALERLRCVPLAHSRAALKSEDAARLALARVVTARKTVGDSQLTLAGARRELRLRIGKERLAVCADRCFAGIGCGRSAALRGGCAAGRSG